MSDILLKVADLFRVSLNRLNINTVLLATCWPGSVQSKPGVTFGGNFLSVYETTDEALSCKEIAKKSKDLISFKEISISTGKEHGAFFKPLEEWVHPVKQWINSKAVSILIDDADEHH